jgi:hypothetical protein
VPRGTSDQTQRGTSPANVLRWFRPKSRSERRYWYYSHGSGIIIFYCYKTAVPNIQLNSYANEFAHLRFYAAAEAFVRATRGG